MSEHIMSVLFRLKRDRNLSWLSLGTVARWARFAKDWCVCLQTMHRWLARYEGEGNRPNSS